MTNLFSNNKIHYLDSRIMNLKVEGMKCEKMRGPRLIGLSLMQQMSNLITPINIHVQCQ